MSAVIAYPFIVISVVLTPWFNFYDNALSDLGNIAWNAPVAYVFNFGMIFSGFLIASFAIMISFKNYSWKYLLWSIPLVFAGVFLMLIGVFPEDAGTIHKLVSIIFFLLLIFIMLIYSFCSRALGTSATGIVALVFSIMSVAVWMVKWGWKGVAIQETVASIMASIWLLLVAIQKLEK
ncbi:MAG: DUF998 domain-containing protein [Ignisphaera sp.]